MKSHKTSKRQIEILNFIKDNGTASIIQLAEALRVSDETIRRDAKILENNGSVLKFHGALGLPNLGSEAPFERRLRDNAEAKRAIAKFACHLVQDGDSLMIDTGTTTSIFAQELRTKRSLTIVTNSSDIARNLALVNGNKVYMAGGALKGDNGASFGDTAVEFFSWFKVKYAFISVGAIDVQLGPMDAELDEANIAYMALKRAEHRVVLSDSSKFEKSALVQVCDFNDFDRLITNEMPSEALKAALDRGGIIVDVVTVQ